MYKVIALDGQWLFAILVSTETVDGKLEEGEFYRWTPRVSESRKPTNVERITPEIARAHLSYGWLVPCREKLPGPFQTLEEAGQFFMEGLISYSGTPEARQLASQTIKAVIRRACSQVTAHPVP